MLGTAPKKSAETQTATPKAVELNPYSELFSPGKYFAYTRRPQSTTVLIIAGDTEAVIKIVKKARGMALRHLPRTHRIDVHWLFEVCSNPRVRMLYVNTKQQVGDLMTNAINNLQTWAHLLDIVQIRPGHESATGIMPAMLATPPGLSQPLSAAQCTVCNFDITTKGARCPCTWN